MEDDKFSIKWLIIGTFLLITVVATLIISESNASKNDYAVGINCIKSKDWNCAVEKLEPLSQKSYENSTSQLNIAKFNLSYESAKQFDADKKYSKALESYQYCLSINSNCGECKTKISYLQNKINRGKEEIKKNFLVFDKSLVFLENKCAKTFDRVSSNISNWNDITSSVNNTIRVCQVSSSKISELKIPKGIGQENIEMSERVIKYATEMCYYRALGAKQLYEYSQYLDPTSIQEAQNSTETIQADFLAVSLLKKQVKDN